MNEIVGCLRCGWVARADIFEGARRRCGDCGGAVDVLDLSLARKLAGSRRSADMRREGAKAHSDLGLDTSISADLG